MSNIDKQAVQAVADLKAGYTLGHADVEIIQQMALDAVTLMGELEAKDSRIGELEVIATDYGMKFQRAQDALKHQSLLHKTQMEAAEKTSAARLGAIDTTHKMFRRERDRADTAEKRIAELSRHLQCAHAFIEHTEAFGHAASNGILCCGDAQWNIDESKSALAAAAKGE